MFNPWHIPALFVASALTFGGMWPYFDATSAIRDFGLPSRIADSKEARGVFLISASRTTVIGQSYSHSTSRKSLPMSTPSWSF
jgi:hypothetical protein